MSSEWNFCKLRDEAVFRQGLQVPVEKQKTEESENLVRFIRISDLTSSTDGRFIEKNNGYERYLVEPDDVVMVRYGDTG